MKGKRGKTHKQTARHFQEYPSEPQGKSIHVNGKQQCWIKHLFDFLLPALTARNCTPTSLEHVFPSCTTQTTTSPSWVWKSSIRLMPESGGKWSTSWKVGGIKTQRGSLGGHFPELMYVKSLRVDQRGKEKVENRDESVQMLERGKCRAIEHR